MRQAFRIGLALATALLAAPPVPVPAATRAAILVHAGFGFPEENNLRGGLVSGFGLVVSIAPRINLTAEYNAWKDTSKQSSGKLYNGTLTLAPIQASIQYAFYRNMYFTAYALGGAAYIVSRFKIGSYASVPEVRIEQSVDNGWGLFGGVGANLAVWRGADFYFEVSYMRRSLPAKTVVHDMNFGDSVSPLTANLRHVFLKAGLKLSF
jgi:hypothetical protein